MIFIVRAKQPGWAMAGLGVGVVAVAAGVILLTLGVLAGGVLLVVLGGLLLALSVALAALSGLITRAGSIEPTSRVLRRRTPPSTPACGGSPQVLRWVGGANVPSRGLGRVNVTIPLAELGCTEFTLRLKLRAPRLIRALGAAPDFVCQLGELVRIFPVRGRLLRLNQGVAIQTTTHVTYFWTFSREPILARLEDLGYPIEWSEHYVALLAA